MKRLLRPWPKSAIVVACIGLGVALGGTSVAASQAPSKNNLGSVANVAANSANAASATNDANQASVAVRAARASTHTTAADFAYGEIDVAGIVKASRSGSRQNKVSR